MRRRLTILLAAMLGLAAAKFARGDIAIVPGCCIDASCTCCANGPAPPPPRTAVKTLECRWNYSDIVDADTSQPIPDSWLHELLDCKPGFLIEFTARSIANNPVVQESSGYAYFDDMVDFTQSDPSDWDPLVQRAGAAIAWTTPPITVGNAGMTAIVAGGSDWWECADHNYEVVWYGQLINGNRDQDTFRLRIVFALRQHPL